MRLKIGEKAPNFKMKDVMTGKVYTLSEFAGKKVVMLDFWMASCPGCLEKMPLVQEVFTKISPADIAIFCVNVGENEQLIRSFAVAEKWTVPILLDRDRIVSIRYRISGFPTTFFIDADGIIRFMDPDLNSSADLANFLNSMVKASRPQEK